MSSTVGPALPQLIQKDRARRLEASKFVDSVFRLEGFEPTHAMGAIRKAVLAGLGDYEEAVQEVIAHVKEHKTIDGFVYSKSMGL